jgi:hypothetical protein
MQQVAAASNAVSVPIEFTTDSPCATGDFLVPDLLVIVLSVQWFPALQFRPGGFS